MSKRKQTIVIFSEKEEMVSFFEAWLGFDKFEEEDWDRPEQYMNELEADGHVTFEYNNNMDYMGEDDKTMYHLFYLPVLPSQTFYGESSEFSEVRQIAWRLAHNKALLETQDKVIDRLYGEAEKIRLWLR